MSSQKMVHSPTSKKEGSHCAPHSKQLQQHGGGGGSANSNQCNQQQCKSTCSKRGEKHRCSGGSGSASTSSLTSTGTASGGPILSAGPPSTTAASRALKSQAEGHFKRLVMMAEGNEEQLAAVVAFLESATRLVDSSQPKLHACLLCSHRADNQSLADAHLADHQKGRRFCCAFSGCSFAAEDRAPVVEHVKRKHFTDEYDTRAPLANNYVHEMGRSAD